MFWVIQKTPLLIAAEHNSIDVAKLLIERGADVNIKDNIHSNIFNSVDLSFEE